MRLSAQSSKLRHLTDLDKKARDDISVSWHGTNLVNFCHDIPSTYDHQNMFLNHCCNQHLLFVQSKPKLRLLICIYSSSTAQGGGGSFKKRKPIGEIGCCESQMSEQKQ